MLLVEYPKCTTCQKAKKWLDENGLSYTDRHIKEENPTYDELKACTPKAACLCAASSIPAAFFTNPCSSKEKLPLMSEEEQLRLLATDGMLVKRPIVVDGDTILVGFKSQQWERLK